MREVRFLVTEDCRRLGRWLRLSGYDTTDVASQPLSELYRRAYNERRIIVTRNRRVRGGQLCQALQLTATALDAQLKQVLHELALPLAAEQAFTRCDRCNMALAPIEKARVKDRVPPYVFQTQQAFHTCPACGRIYWVATHCERVARFFDRVRKPARPEAQGAGGEASHA